MFRRLGCTCCEAEDSYDLERSPVYDTKRVEPRREVKYADNLALETESESPEKEQLSFESSPGTNEPEVDSADNFEKESGLEVSVESEVGNRVLIPEIVVDDSENGCVIDNSPVIIHSVTDQSEFDSETSDLAVQVGNPTYIV